MRTTSCAHHFMRASPYACNTPRTTLDFRCSFLLNHCAGLIPTNGHGAARNPRFRGKQLFWNNYWRELSWQAVSQFKAEGRCNSRLPPPDARPTTPSTFLLLGGDAHYSRQYVMKAHHHETRRRARGRPPRTQRHTAGSGRRAAMAAVVCAWGRVSTRWAGAPPAGASPAR